MRVFNKVLNKKVNKMIEKDVGPGIDIQIEDMKFHVGKDGTVHVHVVTDVNTSIGSIVSIIKQMEES